MRGQAIKTKTVQDRTLKTCQARDIGVNVQGVGVAAQAKDVVCPGVNARGPSPVALRVWLTVTLQASGQRIVQSVFGGQSSIVPQHLNAFGQRQDFSLFIDNLTL